MKQFQFPDNSGWQEPGWPAADTETSCRYCGELIRKRRDKTGNGFEWVSYLGAYGIQPGGRVKYVFSRFCQDGNQKHRRLNRQHGPIPLHDVHKLESWLES